MKRQLDRCSFIFVLCLFLFLSWGMGYLKLWRRAKVGWTLTVRSKEKVVSSGENNTVILLWTNIFGRSGEATANFLPIDQAAMEGCQVTFDKSRVKEADALLFHFFPGDFTPEGMPKGPRKIKQVWVLMAKENPYYTPNGALEQMNYTFNWTMTYRLDSDVEHAYGKKEGKHPIQNDLIKEEDERIRKIIREKNKLMTGVISKCATFSKREKLIDQLKTLIPLDIFGKCGKPLQVRHDLSPEENQLWRRLGSQYKFYLSFENAICVDYITEKFWRALRYGMVPVVYGGGNYSLVAPPHSFIDVRDFPNVTTLTDHLFMLDKNPKEYQKYFEWRKRFQIVDDEGIGLRSLCRKLKTFKESSSTTSSWIKDLKGWWEHGGHNHSASCSPPKFFN